MTLKRFIKYVGLTTIIASSLTFTSCDSKIDQTPNPISQFKDDVVLVACNNKNEYYSAMKTLHDRDKLRSSKLKLSFIDKKDYTKIIVPNEDSTGLIKNTYMHVVIKDKLSEVISKMNKNSIHYNMVQLRGHTGDMSELYELTKSCSSPNAIYFFGGCNSYETAEEMAAKNRVTIGINGIGQSSINTYGLLRLIDIMGEKDATSWSKVDSLLHKSGNALDYYISTRKNNKF